MTTQRVSRSELPTPPLAEAHGTEPYIDALREGYLLLPRCVTCDSVIWYPRDFCPFCGASEIVWFRASGRGTIYSYTVIRRSEGAFQAAVPYVLAYVEVEEGPRILTNIIGPVESLEVGTDVLAVFVVDGSDPVLRFEVPGADPHG